MAQPQGGAWAGFDTTYIKVIPGTPKYQSPPAMGKPAPEGPTKPEREEATREARAKAQDAAKAAECPHHLALGPFFLTGSVYTFCWSDIVFYSLGIALLLWGASLVILGASVGSLKAALT